MTRHRQPTPHRGLPRRIARALLPAIVLTSTLLPAQVSGQTRLSNAPEYLAATTNPNVAFILDDSLSMDDIRLPPPDEMQDVVNFFGGLNTTQTSLICDVARKLNESDPPYCWKAQMKEVLFRSALFNPLYYNPAITYRPWNDNGRAGASGRFLNADTGMTVQSDGFRVGHVRHDMRYTGPNRTSASSSTTQQGNLTTARGANPPSAPDYLNTYPEFRPVRGGFDGASKSSIDNQDIFSSKLALVVAQSGPVCAQLGTYITSAGTIIAENPQITHRWEQYSDTADAATPACGNWTAWGTNLPPSNLGAKYCRVLGETGFRSPLSETQGTCSTTGSEYDKDQNKCVTCTGDGNLVEGDCRTCTTSGATYDPDLEKCCNVTTQMSTNCEIDQWTLPTGMTCSGSVGKYVPNMDSSGRAQWYVFNPPNLTQPPTLADFKVSSNYWRYELNRDSETTIPRVKINKFPKPWIDNDPTKGRVERADCANADYCTWDEEAQNFANWYTYYRTRMRAAIGVTSEALSKITSTNSRDRMRLAYGSLNYFPKGLDPYAAVADTRYPDATNASWTVDGVQGVGQLVRGVRPFRDFADLGQSTPAPFSNNRRQEVFDWLFSLRAVGGTPSREAIDAIGRYLTRRDNQGPWINEALVANSTSTFSPWQTTEASSAHLSCRRNYLLLVSDGEWTIGFNTTPDTPSQPRMEERVASTTGMDANFATAQSYSSATTLAPMSSLFITGPAHTGSSAQSGQTYSYQPTAANEQHIATITGSPARTMSNIGLFWWSRDLRPDLLNNLAPINGINEAFWQNMAMYFVGFGVDAPMNTSSTRTAIGARTAITWPAVNTSDGVITDRDPGCPTTASGCGRRDDVMHAAAAARGDFLAAANIEELAQRVTDVFEVIGSQKGSSTGLAVSSAVLTNNEQVIAATFASDTWSGQLNSYPGADYLNNVGGNLGPPAPLWSASFPTPTAREIFTRTTVQGSDTVVEFALGNLTNQQKSALTANATDQQKVVDYLRGDRTNEGTLFRVRESELGDIVNSRPLYSGARDFFYNSVRQPAAATSSLAASYPSYVQTKKTSRTPIVLVGANDGMLHAFPAETTGATTAGRELWAYIPRAVFAQLGELPKLSYNHLYYVDGPIVEGDVTLSGAWKTVAVATTGAGGAWGSGQTAERGSSIFAVDVTNTSAAPSASMFLWDLTQGTSGGEKDIGYITQPGVIASVKPGQTTGDWYYIVGNGTESKDYKARLLFIRMSNGQVTSLETADDEGGDDPNDTSIDDQPNGLGGITPMYDAQRNLVAVYAGDRLGKLWKWDLSGGLSSSVKGKLMFTTRSWTQTNVPRRQPITAAPRVLSHPNGGRYVVFGTGKLYENGDRSDTSLQSVYALWEQDPTAAPTALTRTDLEQLTLSTGTAEECGSDGNWRQLNGQSGLDFATDKGFYFDLTTVAGTGTGERVITTPIEDFGYVTITSFTPAAGGDVCASGGSSYVYRIDLEGTLSRNVYVGRDNSCIAAAVDGQVAPSINLTLAPGQSGTTTEETTLSAEQITTLLASRMRGTVDSPQYAMSMSTAGNAQASPQQARNRQVLRVWRELPRQ